MSIEQSLWNKTEWSRDLVDYVCTKVLKLDQNESKCEHLYRASSLFKPNKVRLKLPLQITALAWCNAKVKHRVRCSKFIWAQLHVHSCTHWQRLRKPPPPSPAFGLIYEATRALQVNQDRRHLIVTPEWNGNMHVDLLEDILCRLILPVKFQQVIYQSLSIISMALKGLGRRGEL
jgi:hypothetical protein